MSPRACSSGVSATSTRNATLRPPVSMATLATGDGRGRRPGLLAAALARRQRAASAAARSRDAQIPRITPPTVSSNRCQEPARNRASRRPAARRVACARHPADRPGRRRSWRRCARPARSPLAYPTVEVIAPPDWTPFDRAFAGTGGRRIRDLHQPVGGAAGGDAPAGDGPVRRRSRAARIGAVGPGDGARARGRGARTPRDRPRHITSSDRRGWSRRARQSPGGQRASSSRKRSTDGTTCARRWRRAESTVQVLAVSQTVRAGGRCRRSPRFDAAVFASPSALRAFVARWSGGGAGPGHRRRHRPDHRAPAAASGVAVAAVAESPTPEALVAALVARPQRARSAARRLRRIRGRLSRRPGRLDRRSGERSDGRQRPLARALVELAHVGDEAESLGFGSPDQEPAQRIGRASEESALRSAGRRLFMPHGARRRRRGQTIEPPADERGSSPQPPAR